MLSSDYHWISRQLECCCCYTVMIQLIISNMHIYLCLFINTIRIKSSENKQQPGASRSGQEAILGSAVEKLENSTPCFSLKASLDTFLRFT